MEDLLRLGSQIPEDRIITTPQTPFDPFGDWTPDFSNFQYNPEDQQIYSPNGEIYNSPQATIQAQAIHAQGADPQPTLQQLLEAEFNANKPDVSDPADLMPEFPYERCDGFIFFNDSSFAGPILRSEQEARTKDLAGYLILPACYITRIRTRLSNHDIPTPVVFVQPDIIPDTIRAKFE